MNDERGRPDLRDDRSSLRPCQFVLRENRTLTRYDVSNGNELESVFLSSKRKFIEVSRKKMYDTYGIVIPCKKLILFVIE